MFNTLAYATSTGVLFHQDAICTCLYQCTVHAYVYAVDIRIDIHEFLTVHANTSFHVTTDFKPCEVNVCQNGGTCTQSVDLVTCDCPEGFAGKQCQTG